MTNKQEIFILIDDSGKFNINEHSCIYSGLFFYSSKDYMNFIYSSWTTLTIPIYSKLEFTTKSFSLN